MSKKRREKKQRARNKALLKQSEEQPSETPKIPFLSKLPFFKKKPAFADIEAPEGFRAVPMMQAVMDFAEPLTEYLPEDAEVAALNTVMNLGIKLWNFGHSQDPFQSTKNNLVEQMSDILGIEETEALELFDEMVARKAYLFPEDIQPKDPMVKFMRKEVEYLIAKFSESQLNLSQKPIPPNRDDQSMFDQLRRLDQMLADGEEYDAWEDLYFSIEKACCNQYSEWLNAKGCPAKYNQEFPFCVETFLNFVYRYNAISLSDISDFEVEEFFMDYLLRKVITQPNDYLYWPPALRLFYTFLAEKGYLDKPKPFISLFNDIESEFIEILKKRY